jgi:hypothetical protein
MNLAGVQAAVISAAPGFGESWVRSFDWRQNGNIITAKPRYPMSKMCFNTVKKVFKRLGGRYVGSKGRTYYFELVVKDAEQNAISSHSPVVVGADFLRLFSPANEKSESVFTRLQNQLSNLSEAGRQCTEA